MANRRYDYFTGLCKYARLKSPDPENGTWYINIYPNATDLPRLLAYKEDPAIRNHVRKDEDGTFMKISRPQVKKRNVGADMVFEAPLVVDKDGKVITDLIGNGSNVTVQVEVYDYAHKGKPGRAIRLESVRVNELIPYVAKTNLQDPAQVRAATDMAKQPAPVGWP